MEELHYLASGFVEVFHPHNLLMLTVGLLIGMAVSIMPGLGLVMGVVLALPFTYNMAIEPSVILLTAIYFSGTYGGCFTAILYRIPGEPMDVPLLWDGYAMCKRGEARKSLRLGADRRVVCRPRIVDRDGCFGGADERDRAEIQLAGLFCRDFLWAYDRGGAGGQVTRRFPD